MACSSNFFKKCVHTVALWEGALARSLLNCNSKWGWAYTNFTEMQSINDLFYSGTSGINLPVPRSQYPEEFKEKSRLHYYASLFNSIEANGIFYKLPRHSTVANWAEAVPKSFRFTFKVSKTITHVKGLEFAAKDVDDFIKTVENTGDKRMFAGAVSAIINY